ncbi:MAG TPA: JDVT-CTERM domain-containing protein [Verrucomicrobiae bacterium]|nr:JDVT-CTERM domain-containing protein [Verrucomicrobiae bacterium]
MNTRSVVVASIRTFFIAALAWSAAGQAATVSRYVIDDGSTFAYRNPQVAMDASGNLHVVAQGRTNDFVAAGDDIFYFRLSPSGAVSTPKLGITTSGTVHDNGRAHVVTTSTGLAVVAWREHSPKVVKAVLVDPAANAGAGGITAGPVTIMDASVNSPSHFDVAITGTDVHFVMTGSNNLWHARFSATDLSSEVAAHTVTGISAYWQDVKLAADSNGDLHVAGRTSSVTDPWYAKLDTAGVVQIGQTVLHEDPTSPGQGTVGNHLGVAVNGSNVMVLFGDKRNTYDFNCQGCYGGQGGGAYLVTLNPAAHTGGVGAIGDINELRVGSEILIANNWYVQGFRGTDGDYRIMSGSGSQGSGDISYHKVSGSTVSSAHVSANNDAYQYYRKYIVGAGNMIAWAEGVYVPTITGVSTQLVAASTAAFDAAASSGTVVVVNEDDGWFGCTLGKGGPLDPTLPLLASLAALYLARRRFHAAR